jgi:pyrimidine operon attenuation protein/uracil phosphoribosyltransferase
LKTLLNDAQLQITLHRLAHQLIEHHEDFSNTVIIGLQPRGVLFSDRMVHILQSIHQNNTIQYGKLDITFYRDDLNKNEALNAPASNTEIPFSITNKKVILLDDVLHTGRTIRAAMDAILDFGRPLEVTLMTLINRRFSRELPIQPDYVGYNVDTLFEQKVKVQWKEQEGEDAVLLID